LVKIAKKKTSAAGKNFLAIGKVKGSLGPKLLLRRNKGVQN